MSNNFENVKIFAMEFLIFNAEKFHCVLHGHVFVMFISDWKKVLTFRTSDILESPAPLVTPVPAPEAEKQPRRNIYENL